MKQSPYITWAKEKHDVKYNLAGSSMPTCDLNELVSDPAEILKSGSHEDGWRPLMEKIADRYEVDAEQVVPVHSASLANHLIYGLLLSSGDEVFVEQPAYEPLNTLAEYFNASVSIFSRSPERKFQPNVQMLEDRLSDRTKLIVLTDLHNPSGALLDRDLRNDLVSLADIHHCHLLIDEVYLEFLYPEGERTAAKLGKSVITTRSLTKAYGLDDIRAGWIIAEAEIAEQLRRLADLFMPTMAFPSERLALAALEKADKLLEPALKLLHTNFQLVEACIENHPDLSWHPPKTGTISFVKVENRDVDNLVEVLEEEYDTLVVPGRFFGMPDHFRIGWGIDTDDLSEGLIHLVEALEDTEE